MNKEIMIKRRPDYMGICLRKNPLVETVFFLFIDSQRETQVKGIIVDSFCSSPFTGVISAPVVDFKRIPSSPIHVSGTLQHLPVSYLGLKDLNVYHGDYFLTNRKKGGTFILETYEPSYTLDALCESFQSTFLGGYQ